MLKRSLTALVPLFLAGLTASASMAAASSLAPGTFAGANSVELDPVNRDVKTWYFSGTARYIDDWTGEENHMSFSGITARMTREEAMEFAKESGAAQAARRGRVVSVNVDTLF